jgi:hypothetical protein
VTEDASRRGLPTAMGFAAKNAIDALRRRNVATAPALRAAGISERDLAESPPSSHIGRWTKPAPRLRREAIEDTAFGLHLARPILVTRGSSSYAMSAAEKPRRSPGAPCSLFANAAVRMKLTELPRASSSRSVSSVCRDLWAGRALSS